MAEKYLRLPNGKKMEFYKFAITNACILRFLDTDVEAVKEFLGTGIIDYIDTLDENEKVLKSTDIYMKRKSVASELTTVTEYEERVEQEAYDEKNSETGETIHHDAVIAKIPKEIEKEMIVAILEKPSVDEELDNVKTAIGIVNTNNMTIDEFKSYYKEQIGKKCTEAIEGGADVETESGKKHFSYTLEDQSNIKDLMMTADLTGYSLALPYHADGELCSTYSPSDILKIYMTLSSNKTYHTTYCNILNRMIEEAKDMATVKAVTYGMEITDERYTAVMKKINDSKDALLATVEKKFASKGE